MHQMHLNKSGSGMASKTACGRNILRTPMSTDWAGFKGLPDNQKCTKCAESKLAALNTRNDIKKAAEIDQASASLWVPVDDPDAWKAADAALIAKHKANK